MRNLIFISGYISINICPNDTDRIDLVSSLKKDGYSMISSFDKCSAITSAIPSWVNEFASYLLSQRARKQFNWAAPYEGVIETNDETFLQALNSTRENFVGLDSIKPSDVLVIKMASNNGQESAAIICSVGSLATKDSARQVVESTFCTKDITEQVTEYLKKQSARAKELVNSGLANPQAAIDAIRRKGGK